MPVKKTNAKKKVAPAKKPNAKKTTTAKKNVAKKTTAKKVVAKPAAKKAVAKPKKAAVKPANLKKPLAKKVVEKKESAKKESSKKPVSKKAKSHKEQANEVINIEIMTQTFPERSRKITLAQIIPDITPIEETIGDDYMNDSMKQHFRNVLNDWKRQLMQEVDRTVGHMKDEAANFPDLTDRATQEEEFNLELRTRDRERKLIKKIDETLQLIDENEYGYCDACGVEIGYNRLNARPTARLCIDCKTVDEIKEKTLML